MSRLLPLIIFAVLGALALFSITRIKFSAGIYELLPADLPEVRGMNGLNTHFSRDRQLIVTVTSPDTERTSEASSSLASYLEGRDDLVAEVFQEVSLGDLARTGGSLLSWLWFNAAPEELDRLAARLREGRSAEEIARSLAAMQDDFLEGDAMARGYDPLGLSRLPFAAEGATAAAAMSSPDGRFRVLYVEGMGVEFSDYREAARWLEASRQAVEDWRAASGPDEVEVGLTGTPAFMAEIGSAMERDLRGSLFLTVFLVALLFWLMHRRIRPLAWLMVAMMTILCVTPMVAGFIFGDLSVMSAGFAAILMGLTIDYGVVLYREAAAPGVTLRELWRRSGAGVLWAAATTAAVFLSLNLSFLPGIAQLGNLVAIGITIGAAVMLLGFAPVALRIPARARALRAAGKRPATGRRWTGAVALVVPALALISVAIEGFPGLDLRFHPFRIAASPATRAWDVFQREIEGRDRAVPLIVTAESNEQLHANLAASRTRIDEAVARGLLARATLPTAIVPNASDQRANLAGIEALLPHRSRLLDEISDAGFSEDGRRLTEDVFENWEALLEERRRTAAGETVPPRGRLGQWTIEGIYHSAGGEFAALGVVEPVRPLDRDWVAFLSDKNIAVASLDSLGTALNERMRADVVRLFLPMVGILTLMLALAFRSWKDLALSLFALAFSGAALLVLTLWTPLSWNSFNVCALPLLFGTGLDFSIHMIFALRRYRGDPTLAHERIGKALIFCGSSSAIGFGSLALASAKGLATLGTVCAIGIFINMIVAVWLLPGWYRWLHRIPGPAAGENAIAR